MKKLLVLSALLGLLALPVFANHVSFDVGGDHTAGWITDGTKVGEKIDLTFDLMVGIDDYNSLTWSLKGFANTFDFGDPIGTVSLLGLDKALTTTDIGMWAGLPFGFQVNWGYDDPDANEFGDVTGYENEQVYDLSPNEYWGIDVLLSYSMFELEVAVDPAGNSVLAGLAVKEPIPGLNAEVYYFQGDGALDVDEYGQGQIAFGAGYSTEVGGVALDTGATLLLDQSDAAANDWAFGVGADATYNIINVTLGVDGNETDTLNEISATLTVSPIDMVSIYGGMELSFAEDADNFQGADIGINPHVGLVEIYLGYQITSNANGRWHAPDLDPQLEDGGGYIVFDVDY
jgi:hypothetical protein